MANVPAATVSSVTNQRPKALDRYRDQDFFKQFTANAGSAMSILSIDGKNWKLRRRGETIQLRNLENDAATSIDLVLLAGNPHLSKTYYESEYVQGSDKAPDCVSADGIKPDAKSPKPQNKDCASCRHNQFGSKITANGKKGKACADSRRLAVVLLSEVPPYDGKQQYDDPEPCLLKVPVMSLGNLADIMGKLKAHSMQPPAIAMRVKFDPDTSYQKLIFNPIGFVMNEQVDPLMELSQSEQVRRLIGENVELEENSHRESVQAAQEPNTPPPAAQPAAQAAPSKKPGPAPATVAGARKGAAKTPAPAPAAPDSMFGNGDGNGTIVEDTVTIIPPDGAEAAEQIAETVDANSASEDAFAAVLASLDRATGH